MAERLRTGLDLHDAGERLRDVRVISSPMSSIRACFDLMATETDDDWATIAQRMEAVPTALESFEATLREGMATGIVAARRQALACAEQCDAWGGTAPFFENLAARRPDDKVLARAAEQSTAAYATFGAFLRSEYAPKADERDPVGRDRYALFARSEEHTSELQSR